MNYYYYNLSANVGWYPIYRKNNDEEIIIQTDSFTIVKSINKYWLVIE